MQKRNGEQEDKQATIIIATAGSASRADSLLEAIRSLETQRPRPPRILVMFNGPGVSDAVFESISARGTVDVERLAEPGLPNALNQGRQRVVTRYFGFLDDDDTYMPDALAVRSKVLDENPGVDAVATNGYVKTQTGMHSLLPDVLDVKDAPMAELFRQNWLASCGGLFRTATVDERFFPRYAKYFEWTTTAFLLALDKSSRYINTPTFVINETEGSLSASDEYVEAYPGILQRMLDHPLDRDLQLVIKERLSRALHAASERNRERGNRRKAWRYHFRSLFCHGGIKYLPYTRRLII